MRGGMPGAYPSFKKYLNGVFPHPVPLDLYDPFGIFSNASPPARRFEEGRGGAAAGPRRDGVAAPPRPGPKSSRRRRGRDPNRLGAAAGT